MEDQELVQDTSAKLVRDTKLVDDAEPVKDAGLISDRELVRLAIQARTYAYAPYSHFAVGAALLACDGTVYTGCNIENAAYTPSNCAERTAFFKAVSEGQYQFEKIAVVGGAQGFLIADWIAPCGVCRQVMREFCDEDSFRIILARSEDDVISYSLKELLPQSFGSEHLERP